MFNRVMCCRRIAYPYTLQLIQNVRTNLFVRGLSYDTNETVLRDAFTQHGDIFEVRVICHHDTGKSQGYEFVKFASEDAAASAQKLMDGQWHNVFHGLSLFYNIGIRGDLIDLSNLVVRSNSANVTIGNTGVGQADALQSRLRNY